MSIPLHKQKHIAKPGQVYGSNIQDVGLVQFPGFHGVTMTVAYLHHLQSSGLGFYRILFLWAGSIYKGIWRPLFAYCLLYSFVTLFYREILLFYEDTKETFERFCVYANQSENHLPLNFILGFYVTQVQHLP